MDPEPENPYVGPRPFERADAARFFGRAREIRDVVSLVVAQRVVLLYSASGAGKSSLLQAGVLPTLEAEKGFDAIPVARVRADEAPAEGNVFVAGVLASLGAEPGMSTLGEHLASGARRAEARLRGLVLDQYEELFTTHPDRWQERAGLFEALREALDRDPGLRIVLAIREDFLAELDPFAKLLPGALRNRFRLERLDRPSGLAAIERPLAGTGRSFAPGAAASLVDDLLRIRLHGRRTADPVLGEHVEPVQLQVACRSLWAELPPDVSEITSAHLHAYADVDEILIRFYDDAVLAAARGRRREGRIRSWVARTLITAGGTRGAAYAAPDETAGLPTPVVAVLEEKRLVRAEWRANARWYELTHDRLIEPIRTSNARFAARRRTRRLLGAAVALGLAAVFAAAAVASGLVTFPDEPSSGAISVGKLTPNITRGSYEALIGRALLPGSARRNETLGNMVDVQYTTAGSDPLVLRASTVDATTGAPVDAMGEGLALDAGGRGRIPLWAPLPRESGRYAVRIDLTLNDVRLARATSQPFEVAAGGAITEAGRLRVSLRGPGDGKVVSSPAGIDCGSACSAAFTPGSAVSLVAQPSPGAIFAGWTSGDCAPLSARCRVRVGPDTRIAAKFAPALGRSVNGQPIGAIRIGDPKARRKVLVIGCTFGDECAGRAIAERLTAMRAPRGVELWIVPNLNPDARGRHTNARGVNVYRNFPWHRGAGALSEPEARIAHALVRSLEPALTIWYFQITSSPNTLPYVVVSPGAVGAGPERYAKHMLSEGVAFQLKPEHPQPGSAIGWQNDRGNTPGFFVELPFGKLSESDVNRHARAVLAVVRG